MRSPDEMTVPDVLRAAADKLIRDGWTQGSYGEYEAHGPCCLIGAVRAATIIDDPMLIRLSPLEST